MTATCPESEPVIDRSFAAEPPACVGNIAQFLYDQGKGWLAVTADATEYIKIAGECLAAADDWIEAERDARDKQQGADNE